MATYQKKWDWTLIVIGVLLIVCGIVAATYPGLTLVIITTMVGVGYLLSGVGDVAAYFKLRKRMDVSGWALAYAVLDIVLGGLLLLYPVAFIALVPWIVAFGFLLFGIVEIWISTKAKRAGAPGWALGVVSGVVNILCALALFFMPASFALFIALMAVWRGIKLIGDGITVGKVVRTR